MLKTVFIILIFFSSFLNFVYAQKTTSLKSKSVKIDSTSFVKQDNYECSKTKVNVKRSILLSPQIKETSGLIFFNDLLWTHNDDTDNYLYGIETTTGKIVKSVKLTYLSNIDWEEISQDENYIYVGDIGNNKGNRKYLSIYRIDKDKFVDGPIKIDTISFHYDLQKEFISIQSNKSDFDCEAFIVVKDSIYLFTKEWSSLKTSIYSLPKTPGNYSARFINSINVKGLVTGAVYFEEKHKIILCGYSKLLEPFIFYLNDFMNYDFKKTNKRKTEINLPLHQIEAITTIDGVNLFLTNENFSKSIIAIQNKLHFVISTDF